ncbi:hypothetical protein [Nostoc sp. FACHB-110]|uniref:hypothetical protein n=1 Tax=Nostoc sp. FACHB-110 TaxID=2692834 RepID=UPI0016828B2E|nr:hypothetical protein [Nostoc sp. FACHB-110]MBD2437382.1 hypothetical protein [Nostoc sp. FACHB-110]
MIHPDKLTTTQREEIIKDIVTILAHYDGYTLGQELELSPDDPNVVKWKQTAQSIFDAVVEVIV